MLKRRRDLHNKHASNFRLLPLFHRRSCPLAQEGDRHATNYHFCNGLWCGQSPRNIKGLLKLGYPARKLIWYRGGMQDWEAVGLTTVESDE